MKRGGGRLESSDGHCLWTESRLGEDGYDPGHLILAEESERLQNLRLQILVMLG